jgi:hypothetical protein
MAEIIDIPTEEEIMYSMKTFIINKHPLIKNFSPLSMLSVLNESVAIQDVLVYKRIEQKSNDLSIFKASGDKLDERVRDRLPEGRLPGDKAIGSVTFSTEFPAISVITIPIATKIDAIGQNGAIVEFETTETGTIAINQYSTTVGAQSVNPGLSSNVPGGAISSIEYNIDQVTSVINNYEFSGGTNAESDTDLRNRYIYAWSTTGTSTTQLIEKHVQALQDVAECHVYTANPGDIEVIVDYSGGIENNSIEIMNCLQENIAAGIICSGVLAATIVSGSVSSSIDISKGGNIWVRPRNHVSTDTNMVIHYINTNGLAQTTNVEIPRGTQRGTGYKVTLSPATDRAIEITDIIYIGSGSFDFLIGMGIYPYLYTLPRKSYISGVINIIADETPEMNLKPNIEASIYTFLNSYRIGEAIEYSDLNKNIFSDFITSRFFVGIDSIQSCTIYGNSTSINQNGGIITMEADQRIEPGTVTVNITYP